MGTIIVQGNGHIIFDDGFKCALYIDEEGNQYCTAELYPLDEMIELHGNWVFN